MQAQRNVIQFPKSSVTQTIPISLPSGSNVEDMGIITANSKARCYGFYDGDRVIFDRSIQPEVGDLVAYQHSGGVNLAIYGDGELEVVGVVIARQIPLLVR